MTDHTLRQVLANTLIRPFSGTVALLVAMIFLSALAVVIAHGSYRQTYIALNQAKTHEQKLQREWRQLLLEKGTWGNYQRIENIATTKLDMTIPSLEDTKIMKYPG